MSTPGAIKKTLISPERKLRFLNEYMGVTIDAWPKKQKPFDTWLESTLDKRAHKGKMNEISYFKQICRYCHRSFEVHDLEKTKDHIIPVSRGGLDRKENRVPACYNCNQWKADKMPEDWLKEVKTWAKRQVDNPQYTIAQIGLMVSNIKAVIKYAKENEKKVSMYRV